MKRVDELKVGDKFSETGTVMQLQSGYPPWPKEVTNVFQLDEVLPESNTDRLVLVVRRVWPAGQRGEKTALIRHAYDKVDAA